MFKKDGIHYYCNLSSPYLYDGEGIKYIDYDLDVKLFPDGQYKILDQNEYNFHLEKMKYSKELQEIIENELQKLLQLIKNKKEPFNQESVLKHYNEFFNKEKR